MMFRKTAFPFLLSLGELRYGPRGTGALMRAAPEFLSFFTAVRLTL